jgi:cohesin loading factor subunit SCC2
VENNAAKQTALEHLGVIAAKIRTTVLKSQREAKADTAKKPLHPLEDVSSNGVLKPSITDFHLLDRVKLQSQAPQ